jgi:hypothetical protein
MACRGAAGTSPDAAASPAAACGPVEKAAGVDRPVGHSAAGATLDTVVAAPPPGAALADQADERPACQPARPLQPPRDARSSQLPDGRFLAAPDAARPAALDRLAAAPSVSSAVAPRSGDGASAARSGPASEASVLPRAEEPPRRDWVDLPGGALPQAVSPLVAPPRPAQPRRRLARPVRKPAPAPPTPPLERARRPLRVPAPTRPRASPSSPAGAAAAMVRPVWRARAVSSGARPSCP